MTDKTKESKTEQKTEEQVEKAEETSPKWAIELGAKIDKFTDAVTRLTEATSKQDEEEEKPVEEEKPEEEEKQVTEEEEEVIEEEPKEEEKKKVTETVYKEADIDKIVEEKVKKALATPSVKKSLVPKTVEQVFPTYKQIAKLSWKEVEQLAEKHGAPTRRR